MRLAAFLSIALSLTALSAETDVVVIGNPSLPAAALQRSELELIFTSREHVLGNDQSLIAFTLGASDQARLTFERVVLKMTPEQVDRFWVDERIRGNSTALRQVADQALVVRLVAKLPGGIAYVSESAAAAANGQVRVLARISNGKVLSP